MIGTHVIPHMTRNQIIVRLESQGFRWLDDGDCIVFEKEGWSQRYEWDDLRHEDVVDDYMAFEWDRYLQVSP